MMCFHADCSGWLQTWCMQNKILEHVPVSIIILHSLHVHFSHVSAFDFEYVFSLSRAVIQEPLDQK